MDKMGESIDRETTIQAASEPKIGHINVTNLTDEDMQRINILEARAVQGGSQELINFMQVNEPKYYERHQISTQNMANSMPAFGIETEPGNFHLFINTDLVTDSDMREIFLRHESVEAIMRQKQLDIMDVANQLDIDYGLILENIDDRVEHFVAIYHEVVVAHKLGKTEELLRTLNKLVGQVVKSDLADERRDPTGKLINAGDYKIKAKSIIGTNLKVTKMFVEKLR